jgi:hypothetical protein
MATHTMNRTANHSQMATHDHSQAGTTHYKHFGMMIGLSFIAMYIAMYAMVDSFSSVFNNINQVYMAGLMAAPMAIIEILVMRKMYPNKTLNTAILGVAVVALGLFWFGIRNQAAVGDNQFLRSMIPHHSGAILMCNEAQLSSPQIIDLCKTIVKGQQEEIDQMKAILGQK